MALVVQQIEPPLDPYRCRRKYLVMLPSSKEMIQVARSIWYNEDETHFTDGFEIFRLESGPDGAARWSEPNSIYLTDDGSFNKNDKQAGVSPILRRQLEELSKRRASDKISSKDGKRPKLVVIGQNCIEPLEALRNSGREVCVSADKRKDIRVLAETWKKKRREGKKHAHEQ